MPEESRASRHAVGDRRGALVSLEALFDESYDKILRYCAVRLGSESLAEDVASATFVDAARVAAQSTDTQIDVPWLYMVAQRRMIDHWRGAERHRKRLRRFIEWRVPAAEVDAWDDATPELVHQALGSLPDRQRALLTLRYLDDYSVADIASALDLSYRAAESALARARKSFQIAWREVQ